MSKNKGQVTFSLEVPADIATEITEAIKARIKHHKTHLKLYGGIGKAAKKNEPREKLILELEKVEKYLADQV